MKKRTFSVILALALIALLTACGGDSETAELSFTNNLGTEVHNIYLSPCDADNWSDPASLSKVKSGRTVAFDFTAAGKDAGPGCYDFGVIDEDAVNYDLYAVDLTVGDKISLSGDKNAATFTVTHADGTADTFEALIYIED